MEQHDWLAEQFEAHRTHLRAVAYRMLGSPPEPSGLRADARESCSASRSRAGRSSPSTCSPITSACASSTWRSSKADERRRHRRPRAPVACVRRLGRLRAGHARAGPRRPPPALPGRSRRGVTSAPPVRRPLQRGWQPGAGTAPGRVELGLDQKQAPGEVGTAKLGTPEVGAGEVGHAQVGALQVGTDEQRATEVGAAQVGSPEVLSDEVGAPAVDRLGPEAGPHQLARAEQQRIDGSPVCRHVQLQERVGRQLGEAFGLLQGAAELAVERAGRLQAQRLGQVPEQLVELPHDRERLEHPRRGVRGTPPVLPAEGDLGDLLAGAEAVVGGAAWEAPLPETLMDAAAEVGLQVRTGLPGGLVDGEIRRGGEGRRDTAQPEAAFAVGSQVAAAPVRVGCRGPEGLLGRAQRDAPNQMGTARLLHRPRPPHHAPERTVCQDIRDVVSEHHLDKPQGRAPRGLHGRGELMTSDREGLPAAMGGQVTLGGEVVVNRLGFGAMRITGPGIWGEPDDRPEAVRVLRRAVELGVNFIDTAHSYGPEVSERLIAEALHPYPDGLVIATKSGLQRRGPGIWIPDGRPATIRRAGQLRQAQAVTGVVSVQNRYDLGSRGSDDVLAACQREGIAFLPWRPLGGGALTRTRQLERLAAAHDASGGQVAIAWLLARSPVMLPIPGTSSVAHLEENVAAAALRLSPEELDRLA